MDITQAKDYILYRQDIATLREVCTAEERARIYLAIEEWFFTGLIDPIVASDFAFHTLKNKIEQYHAKNEEKSQKARESINARWHKKEQIRTNTNEYDSIRPHTEKKDENKEKENFPPHPLYREKEIKEEKRETPPLPLKGVDDTYFELFWDAYGKKVGKPTAYRAYIKAEKSNDWPGISALLEAVRRWNASYDWQKDNGQFKPYPATWLNRKGWLDELPSEAQPTQDDPPQARGMLKLILEQP